MAVSPVKVWVSGEVLTAADLVAEFANVYNNGQSLGNPWTASQSADGFDLTAMDELAFSDAATTASAAGRLRRNGSALEWHNGTQSADLLTERFATMAGNVGIVPAAVSGTPTQHALFRENVVKGWITVTWDIGGVPSNADSFNVSGITDSATGDVTVTWDRDFASVNYVVVATALHTVGSAFVGTQGHTKAVGSVRVVTYLTQNAPVAMDVDGSLSVIAIGDQ